jgi:hypothetical protein
MARIIANAVLAGDTPDASTVAEYGALEEAANDAWLYWQVAHDACSDVQVYAGGKPLDEVLL